MSCAADAVTLKKNIPSECLLSKLAYSQPVNDCFTTIEYNRYLSNKGVNGALKLIYDYALNCVKNSNYSEALILFGELKNIKNSEASAFNNMGVVYELMNDRLKALEMYSRACLLDNYIYFKENYFACLYSKPGM
jgi:tetratricopeptide (TPR) repeat protein